ncbi:UreD-domain-containing protein [Exidia glandulosa HHB12029]|uniref:UreD-domain-containing protein n=1 Tax=Exidia glandulosa HHB12029 TaxID=1314781 RepID=A0A165PRI9_EXIGL|nr:UreD-domain-containing protein [Exidia glandulosa HHB12029]
MQTRTTGAGRIALEASGDDAVFSELAYAYPLKLLSPRCAADRVGVAYLLNYGGGLVGGDEIDLAVDVRRGTRLLLLTQGTTKIFKKRTAARTAAPGTDGVTRQHMEVNVESDALLCLLPDPATCFGEAEYAQTQVFRLQHGASAIVLDALTAGRMSRGEEWDFARYSSTNEIWLEGRRVVHDAVLLEADGRQPLRTRLKPYSCYATVILVGPLLQQTVAAMQVEYNKISQMRRTAPPDFIWSLSTIEHGTVIVRAAATETEAVRGWLRDMLSGIRDVLGEDAFRMAFA